MGAGSAVTGCVGAQVSGSPSGKKVRVGRHMHKHARPCARGGNPHCSCQLRPGERPPEGNARPAKEAELARTDTRQRAPGFSKGRDGCWSSGAAVAPDGQAPPDPPVPPPLLRVVLRSRVRRLEPCSFPKQHALPAGWPGGSRAAFPRTPSSVDKVHGLRPDFPVRPRFLSVVCNQWRRKNTSGAGPPPSAGSAL